MPKSRSRISDALASGAAGLARRRWLARAPIWLSAATAAAPAMTWAPGAAVTVSLTRIALTARPLPRLAAR